MKRFNQLFTLALLPIDYLAVWAAFLLAYWLRLKIGEFNPSALMPYSQYVEFTAWSALVWIPVFFSYGLYRFRGFRNRWELTAKVIAGSSMALLILTLALFLGHTAFFSRLTLLLFWGLSVITVLIARGLLEYLRTWFNYQHIGVEHVAIIAEGSLQELIESQVRRAAPRQKLVAKLNNFSYQALHDLDINRIILGVSLYRDDMLSLLRFAEDRGIVVNYIPDIVGTYKSRAEVDMDMGYPIIEVSATPLIGWGRIAKRIFDLVLGSIALVIFSPIMLAVAIAIRLDSKGPIIFAQTRVGELGQPFTFYKFRSMFTELSTGTGYGGAAAQILLEKLRSEYNEADGPLFKIKDDPRITKVGKFIRATSLDELAQLFNVLKGDMSLVGPRPALPEEVAQYDDQARRRLLVKPGVTGMWQVSGRNDVTFQEYVRLDTYYLEQWSLWLDLKVIFLTAFAILKRTGR